MNVIIMLLQTSDDGNTTASVLSFMATKADAGRQLSCQAENRELGTPVIEDNWILQIQCKLINDNGDVSPALVFPSLSPAGRGGIHARPMLFPYLFRPGIPVDFDSLSKIVIRRHAGDADPARHVAESEHHTRRHGRLLRLPHTGRTGGLQGGMAASGERGNSQSDSGSKWERNVILY